MITKNGESCQLSRPLAPTLLYTSLCQITPCAPLAKSNLENFK